MRGIAMGWFDSVRVSDLGAPRGPSGLTRSMAPPDAERDPPASGSDARSGPKEPAAPGGTLPVEWFHRYFDALWRLVARLGVAGHSIDDVVQETFIAASRRRADIRDGQERRFLMGTAVRLSSNFRQRAHVRREVNDGERLELEASAVPDAERLLIEKHFRSLLDAALASLPDAHREVFVLYELEGFSTPEIAEILGVPLGTVASRLARARSSFSKAAARSLQLESP
jgi:RNA polymerase sigma-70 factor (ECF subfamily)